MSEQLITALRAPDLEDPKQVCSLEEQGPVYILLVDAAGRAVRVRIPEDACGHYRPETLTALEGLVFKLRARFTLTVGDSGRI